jgi:hypothetical protein
MGRGMNYEDYCKSKPGVSLVKYIDMRFDAVDQAVKIYNSEMNRRLEGMNEIRSQLDRQAAGFITRESVESMLEVQASRIQALERVGIWAALSVVIAVVASFVVWLMK